MNITPRQMTNVETTARPDRECRVRYAGRWLLPVWSRHAGSGLPRLSLYDPVSRWQITVTVEAPWICAEDEILLRDPEAYRALVDAGIARPAYVELHGPHGPLILGRVAAAVLRRLEH